MEEKQVVLIRKQHTPYVVNYPYGGSDGRTKEYIWAGTKGNILNKRAVPYEVFEWLKESTSCFRSGSLIIEVKQDEEVTYAKESIENIEEVEKAIMTKQEIVDMLGKGNHLSLKKALNELTDGKDSTLTSPIKRYICGIASELGIDSSAKRRVLSDWAGIDYENSDLIFDKEIDELYNKNAR